MWMHKQQIIMPPTKGNAEPYWPNAIYLSDLLQAMPKLVGRSVYIHILYWRIYACVTAHTSLKYKECICISSCLSFCVRVANSIADGIGWTRCKWLVIIDPSRKKKKRLTFSFLFFILYNSIKQRSAAFFNTLWQPNVKGRLSPAKVRFRTNSFKTSTEQILGNRLPREKKEMHCRTALWEVVCTLFR